jgi:hypothetical protein
VRRLAALAILLALSAAALALWLHGDSSASTAAAPRAEARVREAPERERVLEAVPQEARAAAAGHVAAALRACPDLDAVVARRAQLLRDGTRSLERDWVADGALEARAFDPHCARELLRRGADAARDDTARLAAFSLVAADAGLAGVVEPEPSSLAWLRSQVDAMPSPRLSGLDPSQFQGLRTRGLIAAQCLAALGDSRERARLVADLASDARAQAALFALSGSCADDVAALLVDALERDPDARRGVLRAMVRAGSEPAFEIASGHRARAAAALERWWTAGAMERPQGDDVGLAAAALDTLDPDAAARLWNERLQEVGPEPRWLHLSVAALARRGTPEDLERLERLVADGELRARIDVAMHTLASTGDESPAADVRASCAALLADVLVGDSAPALRLRAVHGLGRAGHLGPRELAALELGATDPDASVRACARAILGRMSAAQDSN